MSAAWMTAEELGITEEEREALLWVRGNLENGNLRHFDGAEAQELTEPGNFFNMGSVGETNESDDEADCGTVACIGGWMRVRLRGYKPNAKGVFEIEYDDQDIYVFTTRSAPLETLFLPPQGGPLDYKEITPALSIKAIDNFLTTGDPDWDDVLESSV